jgi:hypothetical protein
MRRHVRPFTRLFVSGGGLNQNLLARYIDPQIVTQLFATLSTTKALTKIHKDSAAKTHG